MFCVWMLRDLEKNRGKTKTFNVKPFLRTNHKNNEIWSRTLKSIEEKYCVKFPIIMIVLV